MSNARNNSAAPTSFWTTRTFRTLTAEDERQIRHNITGFFAVLGEWASNDQRLKAERRS